MKDKLVLIGGGGHCKSVLDAALRMGIYEHIVITDPDILPGTIIMGCEAVGNDDKLIDLYLKGYRKAFVTVGSIKSTALRRKLYLNVLKAGFEFPNIMDPSAVVSEYAKLGKGIFVGKNAIINADAVIRDMAIINTCAIVEHDCHVGEFTHIAVGATVCGGCDIGNDVFVGANATIIQGLNIRDNTIIGAGRTILEDI